MVSEFSELKKTIRSLTKPQRAVFDRVCAGDDSCIDPKMADRIIAKGLMVRLGEKRGIATIYRYDVASIPVHMAWCEICSEENPDER